MVAGAGLGVRSICLALLLVLLPTASATMAPVSGAAGAGSSVQCSNAY